MNAGLDISIRIGAMTANRPIINPFLNVISIKKPHPKITKEFVKKLACIQPKFFFISNLLSLFDIDG